MARLAGNFNNSSDDFLPRRESRASSSLGLGSFDSPPPKPAPEVRAVSLADALAAVAGGAMQPMLLFKQLPVELRQTLDAASTGAGRGGFSELDEPSQRALLSVLGDALKPPAAPPVFNHPRPVASPRPAVAAKDAPAPWWQFWKKGS